MSEVASIDVGLADARAEATRAYIDTGAGQAAVLLYDAGNILVASIPLANPCGSVAAGVLTLFGSADALAAVDGTPTAAAIASANGAVCIYGLTVGATGSGAGVELSTATLYAGGTVRLTGGTLS